MVGVVGGEFGDAQAAPELVQRDGDMEILVGVDAEGDRGPRRAPGHLRVAMPPASRPPSMVDTLPVMNEALSPARNATRLATSSLRPGRRSGKRLSMPSSSPIFRISSLPAMYPGQMVLTRIPSGPNSKAADLTRPVTPRFDAEYAH